MILLLIVGFIILVAILYPFVFAASGANSIIKWITKHRKKER